MRYRRVGGGVLCALCLCASSARAAGTQDPASLVQQAEKARAAGDRIGALQAYTEAANALRVSGATQAKVDACLAEKDALTVEILRYVAEIQKQQAEVVQLQRGMAQRLARIAQTDTDVQDRVKKNENKIKDIESILLDVAK